MKTTSILGTASALFSLITSTAAIPYYQTSHVEKRQAPISPKVFIISMFGPEGEAWYGIPEFNVLAQNISLPNLSPLYPEVHCTADGEICELITGEAEINAASTISALVLSPMFNLTQTYFMIAGIAGVNPEVATTGSVTFARYAVQVALQYEFDAREIPANFTGGSGYVAFGDYLPNQYPGYFYGTEVFEVSDSLRMAAMSFAANATLNDTATAAAYRALYQPDTAFAAGASPPSIVACDVATSDVYYSGTILSEAFGNTTKIWTNGTGLYCTTAQEDNATLEVLLRAALANLTDFSRIIVMRTCSDFDRPPPGVSDIDNLFYVKQGGFEPAIANIYNAGVQVVMGIVNNWNSTFENGIEPTNYIGDVFDTLGGTPNFGLPDEFINKRSMMGMKARKRSMARRALK